MDFRSCVNVHGCKKIKRIFFYAFAFYFLLFVAGTASAATRSGEVAPITVEFSEADMPFVDPFMPEMNPCNGKQYWATEFYDGGTGNVIRSPLQLVGTLPLAPTSFPVVFTLSCENNIYGGSCVYPYNVTNVYLQCFDDAQANGQALITYYSDNFTMTGPVFTFTPDAVPTSTKIIVGVGATMWDKFGSSIPLIALALLIMAGIDRLYVWVKNTFTHG
jgi:hypothetical protein